MIGLIASQKLRRIAVLRRAERSVRREPAGANSLGRVVPAAWTAARLVSATSLWGKPAGAGCAPYASAERSGSPGLLNVGRGASRVHFSRTFSAFKVASKVTGTDAGLDATKLPNVYRFTSHARPKCLVPVSADTSPNTRQRVACHRRSRSASPGWAVARSGFRGDGGAPC